MSRRQLVSSGHQVELNMLLDEMCNPNVGGRQTHVVTTDHRPSVGCVGREEKLVKALLQFNSWVRQRAPKDAKCHRVGVAMRGTCEVERKKPECNNKYV
ncbi:hypothetical protein ACLKA7_009255 [Drosophila subpalustris]